jgi:transcriptional regulator with XRE-family HTH domain
MAMIGVNIKRLRENKRLTLRMFARSLDISPSFLSQIETGKASPSLDTLQRIASSLSTTVGNLIGENESKTDKSPVLRCHERQHLDASAAGIDIFLLASPDPARQMEPLIITLEKKTSSGTTMHRHFGQEFVLVLRGTLEITLNDAVYVLKKGDSIYFNSNIPHSYRNPGEQQTEALWVVTPPTF